MAKKKRVVKTKPRELVSIKLSRGFVAGQWLVEVEDSETKWCTYGYGLTETIAAFDGFAPANTALGEITEALGFFDNDGKKKGRKVKR